MTYAIYGDGFVHGLGTIRVDGRSYGSSDLVGVGRTLLYTEKTGRYIYGPIRVYTRGEKDLRLEYNFKVPVLNADWHAQRLYGQVQNIVLSTLKIKGRWNHSHWLGIELVS